MLSPDRKIYLDLSLGTTSQDITLAWIISELVDRPDGPLLSINLRAVCQLQDRRLAWGRAKEHPSRWCIEFQRDRHVGHWATSKKTSRKMTWSDFEDLGTTNEEIHYSVHVGNRYNPESSLQFAKLRKDHPKRLAKMWQANLSETSLGQTEMKLKWDAAQPHATPDSARMGEELTELSTGAYKDDEDTEGIFDRHHKKGPKSFSHYFWKTAKKIANLPTITVAIIINRRKCPTRNLKPGTLVNLLALIRGTLHGRKQVTSWMRETTRDKIRKAS